MRGEEMQLADGTTISDNMTFFVNNNDHFEVFHLYTQEIKNFNTKFDALKFITKELYGVFSNAF
jgi:hypothetical protein